MLNIMLWGCFSANSTNNIHLIKGRMNAEMYQDILNPNLQESVGK